MTPDEARKRTCDLISLISCPLAASIYRTHPNDLGGLLLSRCESKTMEQNGIPLEWSAWWDWVAKRNEVWKFLVRTSVGPLTPKPVNQCDNLNQADLPEELGQLLRLATMLALSRQPHYTLGPTFQHSVISSSGMSPKKFHEISRMTAYVLGLLKTLSEQYGTKIQHIVDIGAGQGYLSRSLCSAGELHVLALDSSLNQTEGSIRRTQQSNSRGSLAYRTFWLGQRPSFESHPGGRRSDIDDATSFERTIDEWLSSLEASKEESTTSMANSQIKPTPVVFVALHACGSLTPSILHKVLEHLQDSPGRDCSWAVASAVIVGCCYNLMGESDFPLSRTVKNQIDQHSPTFRLAANHLQLAAQVPSQWFRSQDAESGTDLSMKKILYRAIITPILSHSGDEASAPRRLGKFNAKAYETFEVYLGRASEKLGINLLARFKECVALDPKLVDSTPLARRIMALHALRSLLGPPVESLIILDRYLWMLESLETDSNLDVKLVNLFDQETGSGRNIGIALYPK